MADMAFQWHMWCHTSDSMANNQTQYVPASKSHIHCWLCETTSRSSHKYLFSCLVNGDKFHSWLRLVQAEASRGKMWPRLNLKTRQVWGGIRGFPGYFKGCKLTDKCAVVSVMNWNLNLYTLYTIHQQKDGWQKKTFFLTIISLMFSRNQAHFTHGGGSMLWPSFLAPEQGNVHR